MATRPDTGSAPADPGARRRFLPGVVLSDRYRIVSQLGRGGMGEVYRADDLKLGQPVALKFLPRGLERSPERLAWLLNEVRLARQVSHPNVCRVYDVGEVEGQHFISMEYVDGEDLASLLRRIGRMPGERAAQVARQICAGLAAAHDQGILHRDLKPSNVMIDGRGRARITDFGLAGLADGITTGDVRSGTPAYMAPEQLAGEEVTVRSDLYALGLVLYELFTGRAAFEGVTPDRRSSRDPSSTPTSPASHVSDLDPAAERAIMRCLAPRAVDRPSSALAVAAALPGGNPLAEALAAGETPSPEMVAGAGRGSASRPGRVLVVAVASVALYVVGSWWSSHQTLRAYVPLEKPPVVLADRAREVIRAFGYEGPIHERPADRAYGYSVWAHQLAWIARTDSSPDRWERLRRSDPGVVSFWYRQSPAPMIPNIRWGSFVPGRVSRWNPFPQTPGGTLVSLDQAGRLELFAYTPHRFMIDSLRGPVPDWSKGFDLAGLDSTRFERVELHYQRYVAPEYRAEWLAREPGPDGNRVRIAAGGFEGHIVLFAVLDPWEIDQVSRAPERSTGPPALARIIPLLFLVLVLAAAFVARSNLRSGRADRRGAARLAGFMFLGNLIMGFCALQNVGSAITNGLLFPVLGTALFYSAMVGILYLALEPYARRIWPSTLVSWSRLISTAGFRVRDPEVGRSVLAGIAGAAPMPVMWATHRLIAGAIVGAPLTPAWGDWDAVLDTRAAVGTVVTAIVMGTLVACMATFILVAARYLLRRRVPAVAAALVLISLFGLEPLPGAVGMTAAWTVQLIGNGILILVLLRYGLLALAVSFGLVLLAPVAATATWTAWYSQPAVLALSAILFLAAYGVWAATAGFAVARAPVPEPAAG